MRQDGRTPDQLRPVQIETGINMHAEGSCIFSIGNTRIHCTASVNEDVPRWLRDSGRGWVTAEYRMLPRATDTRFSRETRGVKGRTAEIQRLIGRALRASIDLEALGPRQITVDCDVLQADGGTRTASICGGMIALELACRWLISTGRLKKSPITSSVGAVSVGILGGQHLLDLPYAEDASAEVDMNLVMNARGELIEVQGTAEGAPFSRADMTVLLDLGAAGIQQILKDAKIALEGG